MKKNKEKQQTTTVEYKSKVAYEDKNEIKYIFVKIINSNEVSLSYGEFLELLKGKNQKFWDQFHSALKLKGANSQLEAYFWECLPLLQTTFEQRPFEFVVTDSPYLVRMAQNYDSFRKHIDKCKKKNKEVISFKNLSGDATLIVPIPKESQSTYAGKGEELDYKNLSQFTKNASEEQQQEFWKEVVISLEESLADGRPKWLSTHGGGVPYLHVRIDENPKYYSHREYKNPNYRGERTVPSNNGDVNRPNEHQPRTAKRDSSIEWLSNSSFDDDFDSNININKKKEDKNDIIVEDESKVHPEKPTQDFPTHNQKQVSDEVKRNSVFQKNKILRNPTSFNAIHSEIGLLPEDYQEVKRKLINNISQRPHEWEIERIKETFDDHSRTFDNGRDYEKWENVLIHNSIRRLRYDNNVHLNIEPDKIHYKSAFTEQEWAEITNLVQSSYQAQQLEQQ
jgi:hypothetical protein